MAKSPLKSFVRLALALKNPAVGWQVAGNGYSVPLRPIHTKHARICLGRLLVSEYCAPSLLSVRSKHRLRMEHQTGSSSRSIGSSSSSSSGSDSSSSDADTASSASLTSRSVSTVRKGRKSMLVKMMITVAVLAKMYYLNLVSWRYLFVFVSGGLFFSTVMGAAGAAFTFGAQKCRRASYQFNLVVRRVGVLLGSILRASMKCSFGQECPLPPLDAVGDKNDNPVYTSRWSAAWDILRDGLSRARQMASDGVKAIKLEAKLSTRAVGKSELIVLQQIVGQLMPRSLAGVMSNELTNALANVTYPNVRSLHLKQFDVGGAKPQLLGARLYDLGEEDLAIDVDIQWHSLLVADITVETSVGAQIPISVRNMHFEGPTRFILTKLSKSAPHYGALLVSLPKEPTLEFDLLVAGGLVTRLPGLRAVLEKSIQFSLAEDLIWPRRIVIPAEAPLEQPELVLSPDELAALVHEDPLLRAERDLSKRSAVPANNTVVKTAVGDEQHKSFNLSVFKEGLAEQTQRDADDTSTFMGDEQRESADPGAGVAAEGPYVGFAKYLENAKQSVFKYSLRTDASRETNDTIVKIAVGDERRDWLDTADTAGVVVEQAQDLFSKYFDNLLNNSQQVLLAWGAEPSVSHETVVKVPSAEEQRQSTDVR